MPFGVIVVCGENFGWSICSPTDKFDKRKALMAAIGRAMTGRDWVMGLEEKLSKHPGRELIVVKGGRNYKSRTAAILDKIKYVKNKLQITS